MSVRDDRVRNGVIERFSRCCQRWLWIGEFRKAKHVKHGRLYRCKACYAKTRPKWRTPPKTEQSKEKRRAWRRAKYLKLRLLGVIPELARCRS